MGPSLDTMLVVDTKSALASLNQFTKSASKISTLLLGGGAVAGVMRLFGAAQDAMREFGKTSAFDASRVENTILGTKVWENFAKVAGEAILTVSEAIDDLINGTESIPDPNDVSGLGSGFGTLTQERKGQTRETRRERLARRRSEFESKQRHETAMQMMAEQQLRSEDAEAARVLGPAGLSLFRLNREMMTRIGAFPGDANFKGQFGDLVSKEFSARALEAVKGLPGIADAMETRDASIASLESNYKAKLESAQKQYQQDVSRAVWREDYSRAQNRLDDTKRKLFDNKMAGINAAVTTADDTIAQLLSGESRGVKARGASIAAGIGGIAGVQSGVFGVSVQNKQAAAVNKIAGLVEKILNVLPKSMTLAP